MILSDVSKYYGENAALKNIDLTLEEGKITAVLGESGAGKTTLLRILAGMLSFEGTVDGKNGKAPKLREGCSYLFQDCMLLPNLTAEGNCKFVLPKEEWGKIGEMLARVGLGGRENALPHELSWKEKNSTIVFVTHDVREAALLAHRAIVLKHGEIALDLPIGAPFPRDFLAPPEEETLLMQALL